jgi:hypothetical protein
MFMFYKLHTFKKNAQGDRRAISIVLNAMKLLLMGFNNLTWKIKYVSSISLYFFLGIGPSRPGVIY